MITPSKGSQYSIDNSPVRCSWVTLSSSCSQSPTSLWPHSSFHLTLQTASVTLCSCSVNPSFLCIYPYSSSDPHSILLFNPHNPTWSSSFCWTPKPSFPLALLYSSNLSHATQPSKLIFLHTPRAFIFTRSIYLLRAAINLSYCLAPLTLKSSLQSLK